MKTNNSAMKLLIMIALPAMMYFLPERTLEKLEHQV